MPSLAAGALVFLTSAAVLVLEILASRLLAPYVGVTLETYTGIIGTVLAGIAAGTWLGGRLADRVSPRRLLGPLVAGGGALALATIPLVRLVGDASHRGSNTAIVLLSLVGFFPPAAVLSAVAPTVVKLQLRDLHETGSVVGRLSALGTAGALVGTFATGFLLVATAPTTAIILAVGAVLVALGLVLWWWLGTVEAAPVAAVLALAAGGGALTLLLSGPCDVESAYYCATVEVDSDRPSGRILRLDTLRHSYVDLDDPEHLEFAYARSFADALAATTPHGALDALHIGGGGFTMPRYLDAVRPGSSSTVLEVDPALVDLARERLGLRTADDLRVRIGDARLNIRDEGDATYDVVFGDAFGGMAVPWHLTTREFVREVRRVLRPGGSYIVNLIDYPPLRFARAEAATMADVFGHVAVVAPPTDLAGRTGGNLVLVASDEGIDADRLRAAIARRGGEEAVITGREAARFAGDAPVLTDDHAPVDQWLAGADRSRG